MNRRRGFIFLFGTRGIVSGGGQDAPASCPRCRQNVTMLGKGIRRWFTLFFIPVIPLGAKRIFSQCPNCGAQFKGTPQQLGKQTAVSGERQMQQAIQMYNSLRNSPMNSVTLNNLLILYLSLREFDQALSAANEFSQALYASEQCMTTLGRVLMEKGDAPGAIKWFDAALGRNAMYGEAAYCKAVALMNLKPPDLQGANTAARVARSAGLDGAEELMRDIENRIRGGAPPTGKPT
jgi:tetratricopeptide (TPR) repeat protein